MAREPNNFCVMPFTSMVIRADGSASPCCMNTMAAARPDGEKIHFYKDRLQEAYDSAFFREVRADMLAGKRHPSCQDCWNVEDQGVKSKRQHENEVFRSSLKKILRGKPPGQPLDLSMNLGNLCNLKCRICGPTSSSRWAAEYLDLFGEDHVPRENSVIKSLSGEESRSLLTNWPYQAKEFTGDMLGWMKQVTRLEFLGGEPFLNKKQFELVKESAARGWARKQKLTFVTNGSTYPPETAIADWEKFREVNVNVSVDGTGEQFEYQRYGAKWPEVTEHIARYRGLRQVSSVNIMLSVSIFNVYYLPELYSYWKAQGVDASGLLPSGVESSATAGKDNWISGVAAFLSSFSFSFTKKWVDYLRRRFVKRPSLLYTSFVYNPHRFDIRVLPLEMKKSVAWKLKHFRGELSENARRQLEFVTNHMLSEDLSHLWPKTLESIWFHDRYRKQKFAEVFPEFFAEANRVGVWYDYETQHDFFFPKGATSTSGAP